MDFNFLLLTGTFSKRTGLLSGGQILPQTPVLLPAESGFLMSVFRDKEPKAAPTPWETVGVTSQRLKKRSTRLSLAGNVQNANPCCQTESFHLGSKIRVRLSSNHLSEFSPAKKMFKDPQPTNPTHSWNLKQMQQKANLKSSEGPILWDPN